MNSYITQSIWLLLLQTAAIGLLLALFPSAGCFHDLLLAQASPTANSNRAAQADTRPEQSLFDMPAEEFFKLEAASRPIDAKDINHNILAAALYHEANQRRREHAKSALGHAPRLDQAALRHARSMAENTYLSHMNPTDAQLRTPWDRVQQTGLDPRMASENIGTHFSIQYKAGTRIYPVRREGRQGFSTRPAAP